MRPWFAHLCGFVSLLFLGVFFFYPLIVILSKGVSSTVLNPYYLERLGSTLYQALLSTLLTVVCALPASVLFARYTFWGKRLFKIAFTIPFILPSVIAGIGFLSLFGHHGLTGLNLQGSFLIILLAHVFYNYAVVVRIVSSYLEQFGQRFAEVAAMLGKRPLNIFFRVTLPLAWPAVLASALLVFIFCFTSFGVIMILAPEFSTLEVEIYKLLSRLLEVEGAALLTLIQLVVVALFTFIYTRLQARLSVRYINRSQTKRPQGLVRIFLFANLILAVLVVLSPLVSLIFQTFLQGLNNFRYLAEAKTTISFRGWFPALKNSLTFALSSTFFSLIIGFAFAYSIVRGGWKYLDSLSLWPLATSPITLGFGYLLTFPALSANPWGVVLAHTLLAFPFVARSLLPSLQSIPANVLSAAKVLGARPMRILVAVEIPILQKALLTAASFAFAISLGEFGATLVLQNPNYATLPVAIFDRLSRPGLANYGAALALSFILMLIAVVVMAFLERLEE